ncbi:hypothetical protein AB0J83_07925 [Actinoplanes sp. NPDC049596]|uniref:hypothetical protein n=1 Tax=unclassified Actinoplanes TaxID=2626549 RepID=UPI00343BF4E0
MVVVASLTAAGLSACRSEPSVAAYVGDSGRVTEKRVQQVWDDAQAALTEAGAKGGVPISRGDIVKTLVSADVMTEVAKRENVALPANLPLGDYATQLKLPESAEYVRLYAESDALIRLLRERAGSSTAKPTDEDLKSVYDKLAAAGEVDPAMSFDQFKTQLPADNQQLVSTSAAVRDEVASAAGELRIKVNPRYQPLQISVLDFQTQNGELRPLVTVPLGTADAGAPVLDVS